MASDSEDDCYGNIAQKLQKIKNKYDYDEDKIDMNYLLDDSAELETETSKRKSTAKKLNKATRSAVQDKPRPSFNDLPDISQEVDVGNTRRTRSSTKRSCSDLGVETLPPRRASRRKNDDDTSECSSRGRGRARGRGPRGSGRGRGRQTREDYFEDPIAPVEHVLPTYNVGNCDEYPDQSNNQALFSNQPKNNDVIIIDDMNDSLVNEELSVKVYWQSSEFFKFMIRRYQKITQIFDYFSGKENVTHDKLLFTFNQRILKPEDTPDSIQYNIVKFIDGGIVNQSVSQLVTKDEKVKNGVKIKFQCQNVKTPFEITINLEEKLSVAMMKYAEHLEKPLDKLRFEFDGDNLAGKNTARELEFEGVAKAVLKSTQTKS